jgi:hypothetical protein
VKYESRQLGGLEFEGRRGDFRGARSEGIQRLLVVCGNAAMNQNPPY